MLFITFGNRHSGCSSRHMTNNYRYLHYLTHHHSMKMPKSLHMCWILRKSSVVLWMPGFYFDNKNGKESLHNLTRPVRFWYIFFMMIQSRSELKWTFSFSIPVVNTNVSRRTVTIFSWNIKCRTWINLTFKIHSTTIRWSTTWNY